MNNLKEKEGNNLYYCPECKRELNEDPENGDRVMLVVPGIEDQFSFLDLDPKIGAYNPNFKDFDDVVYKKTKGRKKRFKLFCPHCFEELPKNNIHNNLVELEMKKGKQQFIVAISRVMGDHATLVFDQNRNLVESAGKNASSYTRMITNMIGSKFKKTIEAVRNSSSFFVKKQHLI